MIAMQLIGFIDDFQSNSQPGVNLIVIYLSSIYHLHMALGMSGIFTRLFFFDLGFSLKLVPQNHLVLIYFFPVKSVPMWDPQNKSSANCGQLFVYPHHSLGCFIS
jgi:hypothetical protein